MTKLAPLVPGARIAYFSMEIALRPEIHTYGGGLGVLAGDTVRTCADLKLPVVFVTLASHSGYFRQEIDAQGRQVEHSDPWDVSEWATSLGAKIVVTIEGREVWVRPWVHVVAGATGYEVPVLLLDTDLEENNPQDRELTDQLYGRDQAYRLRQEVVLGVGGVRILRALGLEIDTYHLNEGHSALLALELLRHDRRRGRAAAHGETFYDIDRVRNVCVFTTHTPVDAGHDKFSYDLVRRVLGEFFDIDRLKELAGPDCLNMTRLALNLSGYVNGVAKRHAETSARLFPGYRLHAITNGVHVPTWVCPSFARLYDASFPTWRHEPEILVRADQLPGDEVWAAHREAKAHLAEVVRRRDGPALDPDLPIIGFARRMTGYKRPYLLFEDVRRLARIGERYPFQVVMAGKAHPKDGQGKEMIARIHEHIRALSGRPPIVFLENYEMELARQVVAGVDVWLNLPLPPHEASGTSGMKAALNGVLNVSVLDGWWIEAWIEGNTGWAVGTDGGDHSDEATARALYDKLEDVVLALYHDDREAWVAVMKQSISKIASYFNSHRMIRRYATEAYLR